MKRQFEYKDYWTAEEVQPSKLVSFGTAFLTVWTIISIIPLLMVISISRANHEQFKEIERLERLTKAQSEQIKKLTGKGEADSE